MRPEDAELKIKEYGPLIDATLFASKIREYTKLGYPSQSMGSKANARSARMRLPGRRANAPRLGHPRITGGNMTQSTCSVENCEKPHMARGFCKQHYAKWRATTDELPPPVHCSIEGCSRASIGRGWCGLHYKRFLRVGDPLKVLKGSERRTRWPKRTVSERFWAKVDKNGLNGCWLWTAFTHKNGYGRFGVAAGVGIGAHRWSWSEANGPIPEGFEIDHLCFVKNCVNPAHLEAVTPQVNSKRAGARITHCPQGHLYDEGNVVMDAGRRKCRICLRERSRRRQQRAAG